MKVLTRSPFDFSYGDSLEPGDLNTVNAYVRNAIYDVAERRFTRSMLTYSFVESLTSPYTNTGTELLTYRFTCPNTCVIERAYLSANMTSSAEVKVDLLTAAGTAVTGAISPLLTTGGAVASALTTVEDFSGNRIVLTAGAEYKLTVSTAATQTFTLNRFDVTLHVLTDRWTPAGVDQSPTFSPSLYDDTSPPDAGSVSTNQTAASTVATKFSTYAQAPSPVLFTLHNFSSSTATVSRSFSFPRFDSARALSKVVAMYVYAFMSGTGGSTVSVTLQDNAGSTLVTTTANVSGVPYASAGGAVSLGQDLSVATTGVSVDVDTSGIYGSDWILVFTNAALTTASKVHCLLWLSR